MANKATRKTRMHQLKGKRAFIPCGSIVRDKLLLGWNDSENLHATNTGDERVTLHWL